MLILSTKLQELPVMSLQTGAKIADIGNAVIDPGSLTIVAYHLSGKMLDEEDLLLTQDIREVSSIGTIVDSVDEFVTQGDMVKLTDLFKLQFELIGKTVLDEKKEKLGIVQDYGLDPVDFKVYQLHIKRPLIKSLQTSHLIVNRTQIKEITNKNIIVSSLVEETQKQAVQQAFVNPFRKTMSPPAETKTTK